MCQEGGIPKHILGPVADGIMLNGWVIETLENMKIFKILFFEKNI